MKELSFFLGANTYRGFFSLYEEYMDIWDWVILASVAAGVVLAVTHTRKNRKSGKCPGGCDGCSAGTCAKKEQNA